MGTSYDRLSAHDAGYLSRETDTQPLHYVLQADLGGLVSLEEVRRHVAGRVGLLPPLHRRLRYPLLKGRPVWVDDPDFAVERQVVGWDGPCETQTEVHEAFLALTALRLPRDRPLWRLTVGSSPTRSTMWLSVHHSMMDGGLVARVLAELFPGEPAGQAPPWTARRAPSRAGLLVGIVLRRVRPQHAAAPTHQAAPGEPPVARALAGPVSAARAVAATTIPLEHLRPVRQRTGATINDLFLAAVTTALRDFLPAPQPQDLLALVPRDVRSEEEATAIGNRGWSMHVLLPVGVADADSRLAAIRQATSRGKQARQTAGPVGWRFDIALTNVRLGGPHTVADVRIDGYRVSVPLQGENRLVATATSYDGDLTVTFTGDGEALPDLDRLAALTGRAFEAMS